MSNPSDVVNRTISKSQSNCDPAQIILDRVQAMDNLKTLQGDKLSINIDVIQSDISRALMQMIFQRKTRRNLIKAVNQNAQTKH